MSKDDCGHLGSRRRGRPGRPLLTAVTTTGVVSLMTGCTSGNLVPPPSYEVCFDPPTAYAVATRSYSDYTDRVFLDERGCGRVWQYDYPQGLRVSSRDHCTRETSLEEALANGGVVVLSPLPCPVQDLGVPDQGIAPDQGVADAGQDAGTHDASVTELGLDADLEDGG
jgi:hypothetical protein